MVMCEKGASNDNISGNIIAKSIAAVVDSLLPQPLTLQDMSRSKANSPLEQWQVEDAGRLREAYKDAKAANPALTQEYIGQRFAIGGQAGVSHYINGRIPLNIGALLKFCVALGRSPASISPRLARMVPFADVVPTSLPATEPAAVSLPVEHVATMSKDGVAVIQTATREDLQSLSVDPMAYGVVVDGDALSPLPTDGQVLVVEPNTKPQPGRLVLATHTDGTVRLLTYLYDQGERTYLQHPHRTGPQVSYRKSELAKLELVAQVLNR